MNKGIALWFVGIVVVVTTSIILLFLSNSLFFKGKFESVQNQAHESSFEQATNNTTEVMSTQEQEPDVKQYSTQTPSFDTGSKFYLDHKGEASNYSKKDGKIYFRSKVISGADEPSFVVFCGGTSDLLGVARDKENVYYRDIPIEGVDSETFQVSYYQEGHYLAGECEEYAKDKNYAYYFGSEIVVVSQYPNSFAKLLWNSDLWTDGQSIFDRWGAKISADATNFIEFSPAGWDFIYAKDSNQIYTSSYQSNQITPLSDIDAETFLVLDDWYAKDKDKIYFKAISEGTGNEFITPLIGADAATFILVSNKVSYDATDKDHKYYKGNIVE